MYLGLGSNLGDSEAAILGAFRRLEAGLLAGARLSSLYRTEPRDVVDQPEFLNAAACGDWAGTPQALLAETQAIEAEFGRNRAGERPKGPRTLDIDILLFSELVMESPGLTVPHPRLHERLFALVPLLELEPGLRDPRNGAPLAAIREALPEQGIYLYKKAAL